MDKILENELKGLVTNSRGKEFIVCSDMQRRIVNNENKRGPCGRTHDAFIERMQQFLIEQNYSEKNPICNCLKEFVSKTETTHCALSANISKSHEIFGDDLKSSQLCAYPIAPCPVIQTLKKVENKVILENNDSLFGTNHHTDITAHMVQQEIDIQNNFRTVDQTVLIMKDEPRVEDKISDAKPREKKKKSKFTIENIPNAPGQAHKKCQNKKQNVPKHMGWLWNKDIPGLKYRPEWRPGAVTRRLRRLYRRVGNTHYLFARKKKKVKPKKEKGVPKPTVIITKKDGEFEIQMEILKSFSTERLIHQYPYEDTEPYMYKIGRTDEENEKRKLKIERRERRRKRRNNKYLHRTFMDTCKDVCLKAYQQAIGELPIPDPNNPECPCFPKEPIFMNMYTSNDSCSCSDSTSTISDSDCDNDWVIQFTPPAGKFDPNKKSRKRTRESSSQYSHLDFKVKIVDRDGKPLNVPRYFVGPDGKEYCSDLGGFMGPDGKWLVIGRDGTIGADGKWIPYGKHDANGKWIESGNNLNDGSKNGFRKYPEKGMGEDDGEKYPEKGKGGDMKNKGAVGKEENKMKNKVKPMQSLIYMPKITSSMCPKPSMPISCMQQVVSCEGRTVDVCHSSWAFGSRGPC